MSQFGMRNSEFKNSKIKIFFIPQSAFHISHSALGGAMQTILILYHSRSGNTEEMAKAVEEGVKSEGVKVLEKR